MHKAHLGANFLYPRYSLRNLGWHSASRGFFILKLRPLSGGTAARKESNLTKMKKTKNNQPRPLPFTDTGNMERFIRDHRHVIKSGGHDRQWYVWTGQRWKPSPRDAAFNLALKTVENIGLEAVRSSTPSEAEELRKWHKTSQSEAKNNAMLKMAAQHEAISVSAGAFDTDRMLLNCANGLVDLRTGELLERGPEHLVSKLVDVDYDPTAKCPRSARADACSDDPRQLYLSSR